MSCKTADARGKIKDGAIKPPTGVRTDVRGWFGGGVCAGGVSMWLSLGCGCGGRSGGLPTSHWVHMQEVDDDSTQI